MKSVGEAMAIGRTFKEALQKGVRSMEVKRFGFGLDRYDKWLNAVRAGAAAVGATQAPSLPPTARADVAGATRDEEYGGDNSDKTTQGESLDQEWPIPDEKLRRKLAVPSQGRLYYVRYALKMGWSIERVHELTNIDPWFLAQMRQLVEFEDEILAARDVIRSSSLDQPGTPPCEKFLIGEHAESVTRLVRQAKQWGYSDVQLATAWGISQ